jgi:hypothetical protein
MATARTTAVTGRALIGAAIAFWLGWLLMPGVGITDAGVIFERVGADRNSVRLSSIVHLVSAGLFASAMPGITLALARVRAGWVGKVAVRFLAAGACGIAADAVIHLVAYEMTAPGVDRTAMLPVMIQLQTTDLMLLMPFILAFFLGAGALAGAASRAGLVSRWNPRLHGIAFAIAIVGGIALGPRGGGRVVGLTFLALVSASLAWVGFAMQRDPAT